jgi:hypothetical protein
VEYAFSRSKPSESDSKRVLSNRLENQKTILKDPNFNVSSDSSRMNLELDDISKKQKKAKKVPKFSGKSKSVVQKTVKTGQKTSKYNRNKEK